MAKGKYALLTEQNNLDDSISSGDEVRHSVMIIAYSLDIFVVIESKCGTKKWESNERNEIYSRAWDVVEYENIQFQGGIWTKTPYKGPPSPAVDAAWNALADTYVVAIPPDALHKMNKSKAAVSFPPNSPRRAMGKKIHEGYYKDKGGPWEDGAEMLELHVNHCIDMLRVKLMCDSEVSMEIECSKTE
ncbi:hypothetical protein BDD12DRAFT_880572 [Trichophaea hybrida]|nr:hypothetical protein BDD12DRAFT_880572 [Trichophaea hybrida]